MRFKNRFSLKKGKCFALINYSSAVTQEAGWWLVSRGVICTVSFWICSVLGSRTARMNRFRSWKHQVFFEEMIVLFLFLHDQPLWPQRNRNLSDGKSWWRLWRRQTCLRTVWWRVSGLSSVCSVRSVWSCRSRWGPTGGCATPPWSYSVGWNPSASETCSRGTHFVSHFKVYKGSHQQNPDYIFQQKMKKIQDTLSLVLLVVSLISCSSIFIYFLKKSTAYFYF